MPPGFESGKFFKCDFEGCVFVSQTKRGLELHVKRVHSFDQREYETNTGNIKEKKEDNYCERSGNVSVTNLLEI